MNVILCYTFALLFVRNISIPPSLSFSHSFCLSIFHSLRSFCYFAVRHNILFDTTRGKTKPNNTDTDAASAAAAAVKCSIDNTHHLLYSITWCQFISSNNSLLHCIRMRKYETRSTWNGKRTSSNNNKKKLFVDLNVRRPNQTNSSNYTPNAIHLDFFVSLRPCFSLLCFFFSLSRVLPIVYTSNAVNFVCLFVLYVSYTDTLLQWKYIAAFEI